MDPFLRLFIISLFFGITSANRKGSRDFCEKNECSSLTKPSSESPLIKCQKEIGKKEITSLSGMVGMGWDNLQNLPMAQVLDINYSKCLTTPDGEFLIPNNMQIIPIKKIHLDKTANFHSSLSEYVNSNAESINLHAGVSYGGCGVSGSFSAGHQFAKKQFSTGKTSMFVTTIDYLAYKTLVQSSADLHPDFKQQLRSINHAISHNLTARARYLAELVIRDFGTHLVTSADVGARIQQEDYVSMESDQTSESTIWSMKAAVSTNFFSAVSAGTSVSAQVTDEQKKQVSDVLSHSKIETKGGPNVNHLLKTNDSSSLEIDDLVVTDRSGVPLFTLINENTMPELEYSSVEKVSDAIRDATRTYYRVNEVHGCMNPTASNFDIRANMNGSCDDRVTNQRLGGIYQTCDLGAQGVDDLSIYDPDLMKFYPDFLELHDRLCLPFRQSNIATNDYRCPVNYEPVQILETHYPIDSTSDLQKLQMANLEMYEYCRTKLVIKWQAHIKTYYCRARPDAKREDGFMFGGFYTNDQINLVTGSATCPQYYVAHRIFRDSFVCLSREALGEGAEVQFGGFFSCQSEGDKHGCPIGFTQHTATVENGCEVLYCVQPQAFIQQIPSLIKRPPFEDSLSLRNETRSMVYFYHKNGTFWHKHEMSKFVKNITHHIKNGTWEKIYGERDSNGTITKEELNAFIQKEYLPRELEKLDQMLNRINEKEEELVNKTDPIKANEGVNGVYLSIGWLIGFIISQIMILLSIIISLIIIYKRLQTKSTKYDVNHQSQ